MKKIFRMANAEMSKIFMRPSMFVLTTILVFALIFSFLFFAPAESNTKFTYDSSNTTEIHNSFAGYKHIIEEDLFNAKQEIEDFINENGNIHAKFSSLTNSLYYYFENEFNPAILTISEGTDSFLSTKDLATCKDIFSKLNQKSNDILDFMNSSLKNKEIDFIMTKKQYDEIYNIIKKFNSSIPSNTDLEQLSVPAVKDRANVLNNNFDIKKLNTTVNNFETIKVDNEKLLLLLDNYYYTNFNAQKEPIGKLLQLDNNIENYYLQHVDTMEQEHVDGLNELIAQYYDYVQICVNLISNEFELLRIGTKTDDQIKNYIGFEGVSKYNLQKDITTSKYFYENETFGYEYLSPFNFNVKSGTETNAFDFAFYAMQILSCFIIIFVIFFATSTLTGEQNQGTLKMVATRPFTRNKLYSGKLLACFNVALILLFISLISSLAIGFAMYGFSMQNVLMVINANNVVVLNPFLMLLIYFASLLIDVIFYIVLAVFISMLIKPTTISTGISSAIFIASTIMLGLIGESWIRLIPSLNLGLYKFFTNSSLGFLSFSVVPNTNLLSSSIVTVISIIGIDLISRLIFTRKSLDR